MEGSSVYDIAVDDMLPLAGDVATITAIHNHKYLLNIQTNSRTVRVWTDEMFEGLAPQTDIGLSPDDLLKFLTSNQ